MFKTIGHNDRGHLKERAASYAIGGILALLAFSLVVLMA